MTDRPAIVATEPETMTPWGMFVMEVQAGIGPITNLSSFMTIPTGREAADISKPSRTQC